MLTKIELKKFTAFENLPVKLSPGVNLFLGENGTGKTHLMKALYAACDITMNQGDLAEKIVNVFLPSGKQIGRLVKRSPGNAAAAVKIFREVAGRELSVKLAFDRKSKAKLSGATKEWMEEKNQLDAAYIPVKDMMANAKGFRSLYEYRNIHFEEVHLDILHKAFLPALKGQPAGERKRLMCLLEKVIGGKVIENNEVFYLKNKQGELEFTLLAEGYRKLGLLWVLLENGTLLAEKKKKETVLFWDEPETNLNPKQMQTVIGILLALQRQGVQIFIATHDYLVLKEFDLQSKEGDKVTYHTLHRPTPGDEIQVSQTDAFNDIGPNAIDATYEDVLEREFARQDQPLIHEAK